MALVSITMPIGAATTSAPGVELTAASVASPREPARVLDAVKRTGAL